MATAEFPPAELPPAEATASGASPRPRPAKQADPVSKLLMGLASLRLTVGLFAAAVLLILFGSLAQIHYDVWHVVWESHFHVWFAWIEWRSVYQLLGMLALMPESAVKQAETFRGGFYFPGGQLIGSLMMANLLGAHALRFRVTARGERLVAGLVVLAVGAAAVAAVVMSGNAETASAELSPSFAAGLWNGLRAAVAGLAVAGSFWAISSYGKTRLPEWTFGAGIVALVIAAAVWLLMNPTARLDDAGLKILWHLVLGTAAGAILLAGCVILFGRRAGIVVIHGGVGLLMVGEMLTGLVAEESQMTIAEGQTVNYAVDIRKVELAITDRTNSAEERVSVIPQGILTAAAPDTPIEHDELPFDLRVLRFDNNSFLELAKPDDENTATAGTGTKVVAVAADSVSGLGGNQRDMPSAYVELLDKQTGASLGVYLVSLAGNRDFGFLREQPVSVGDTTYGPGAAFQARLQGLRDQGCTTSPSSVTRAPTSRRTSDRTCS